MLTIRERPPGTGPPPPRPPEEEAVCPLLLSELDVLQAWRDRDVNDLDVDDADDLQLRARLREQADPTDWVGVC